MRRPILPIVTLFVGLFSVAGSAVAFFLLDVAPELVLPTVVLVLPIAVLFDRARTARVPARTSVALYLAALAIGVLPIATSTLFATGAALVGLSLLLGLVVARMSRVHGTVVGLGADRVTLRTARDVLVSFPRSAISAASGFLLTDGARMSVLGWGKLGPSSVPFRREATVEFSPLLVRATDRELTRGILRHVRTGVLAAAALTLVAFAGSVTCSLYFPGCALRDAYAPQAAVSVDGEQPNLATEPPPMSSIETTDSEPAMGTPGATRRCALAIENGRRTSRVIHD